MWGVLVLVRKIDDTELLSISEAREKYKKYFVGFVTTEQNLSDPDNTKGFVVYVMDSHDEGYTFPRRTEDGKFISVFEGYAVGGTEIGALIYGGAYHD